MKIDIIAGARPNFMKIAPLIASLEQAIAEGRSFSYRLIHTGQHYDKAMSQQFFDQLRIPQPHINLEVGSGTQAEQTARIMERYEAVLLEEPSDLCVVVGDVTSTMACSIAAKKLHIKVAHIEGGIRSGDMTMPEEVNRIVTDSITDYFFTTSETANSNLRKAGVKEEQIFFVGNTMIDTLLANQDQLQEPEVWKEAHLEPGNYFVMTLHRPNNVDEEEKLFEMIEEIIAHSRDLPIIFPVHPRTRKTLSKANIHAPRLHMIEPLGYLEFIYLVKSSRAIITDSGGITEEATVLGIPCMTLRNSTERPETVDIGTNELLGTDPKVLAPALNKLFNGNWKTGKIPELWDGKTAQRIVARLDSLRETI